MDEGLGVSLVNKVPEELVFITLSGIDIHFTRTAANEVLELSIQNIQVSSPQPPEHVFEELDVMMRGGAQAQNSLNDQSNVNHVKLCIVYSIEPAPFPSN